jgi:hypothetical protein
MRISKRSKSLTSLNWAWGIGGAGGATIAPPSVDRNRSKTVSFQRHVQIISFGRKFSSLTVQKSGNLVPKSAKNWPKLPKRAKMSKQNPLKDQIS